MKKYHIVFVFIHHLLTLSHTVEKNRLSLNCEDGYQIDQPILVTKATSLKECGIHCLTSSKCNSFSFTEASEDCFHDNHKFKHSSLVTVAKGSKYCATADEVLVLFKTLIPFYQKCPVGTEMAKLSQIQEANQQGLHCCDWGWVKESNDLIGPLARTALMSSQSNDAGCQGAPGVHQNIFQFVDKLHVWCILSSKLTGALEDIDLQSQWILDPGLTNQA